jgi:hypothetical protein
MKGNVVPVLSVYPAPRCHPVYYLSFFKRPFIKTTAQLNGYVSRTLSPYFKGLHLLSLVLPGFILRARLSPKGGPERRGVGGANWSTAAGTFVHRGV